MKSSGVLNTFLKITGFFHFRVFYLLLSFLASIIKLLTFTSLGLFVCTY